MVTTALKTARPHSPTLDTQLMIERCVREAGSFPSRRALMRALPRQVEYPTLAKILVYLEASNKILLAEDGSIVWVFADNPKLLNLLAESPVMNSAGTLTSTSISSRLGAPNRSEDKKINPAHLIKPSAISKGPVAASQASSHVTAGLRNICRSGVTEPLPLPTGPLP